MLGELEKAIELVRIEFPQYIKRKGSIAIRLKCKAVKTQVAFSKRTNIRYLVCSLPT